MGWATLQELKDDLAISSVYRMPFSIFGDGTQSMFGNRFISLWNFTGQITGRGLYPSVGLGNGVAIDKTAAGAMNLGMPDAPAGQFYYPLRVHIAREFSNVNQPAINNGGWWIFDRLAHVTIAHDQASGAISPALDGTARLAAGEGALILAEVVTALSGSNTFTLNYTNQAGAAKTTQSYITTNSFTTVGASPASNTSGSAINGNVFVSLAAGDRGARTLTDWTLAAGTATGSICFSLVKPVLFVPALFLDRPGVTDRDLVMQRIDCLNIHEDACLFLCEWQGSNPPNHITARKGYIDFGIG